MSLHRTHSALLSVVALLACLFVHASSALAEAVVNFDTGKTLQLQTSGAGTLTLSLTNAGNESAFVNSYTLGILVVPTSGSGTLTLDAWTGPASAPLLSDVAAEYTPYDQPVLFPLIAPVTISGTEYFEYFQVQAANTNGFDDPLGVAASRNIGTLNFSVIDGNGTWDIYMINQEAQEGGLPISFLQDSELADFPFGNLPAVNGEALLVGTVTAVPEPTTLLLAGCGCLSLAVRRFRRGRTG